MSSKIIITSDSTSDLSPELIEKYDIKILPLHIVCENESFKDGVEITQRDVFRHKEQSGKLYKSAAPNIAEWDEFFDTLPENDGVINFTISSDMSSTYFNALNSSEDRNVYNIDSRNLSTGIGLLILTACNLREQGLKADEIAKQVNALRDKVQATFVIDTLEYLYKGGRCSALAALGANLLKLKPCIEVVDGKMGVGKKYRGKIEDVILNYVKDRLENADYENDMIFVTHTLTDEKHFVADKVINYIKENFNFKNIYETSAGCTISVHCGPNTLGILFIGKNKFTH